MIQVGQETPRVFMLGGGDYKTLPDSMFLCRELVKEASSVNFNLKFIDKKRMRFARHGHSCCALANRYIIVSGSRKEVNSAAQRVEIYDTEINDWMELSKINEGRHYHSSCNINDQYVYIFGGIQNQNKKYSSSIERMEFSIQNFNFPWEKITLSDIPSINQSITARQGAGMTQLAPNQIMIVGGFNGKFLSDYYIIHLDEATGKPTRLDKEENEKQMMQGSTLFPF
jgi:N-acetylneuraminic acid mutarotase